MRRPIITVLTVLGLSLSVLGTGTPAAPAAAAPARAAGPATSADGEAQQALSAARLLLHPPATAARRSAGTTPAGRADATLVLRDLYRALPELDASDRRAALAILARPTDGARDPQGDGYTVRARARCRGHVCIHWVPRTADAPPSMRWVLRTLRYVNRVWRTEVGTMGYRAPASDGKRGGNAKLDVYLKDIGDQAVYGYCAPERRLQDTRWLASGYCVLDDDFSPAQYGAPALQSLHVTAAHEFFHAVQFNYDYAEDPWLMEASATWMEERVADEANDNRQYVRFGQVGRPSESLDEFRPGGFNQYGNWVFFEYLSSRFGTGIVRSIWQRAGAYRGAGREYSTQAVAGALARHGGFTKVYRAFAAGNVVPAATYPEGGAYAAAPASQSWRLSAGTRRHAATATVGHLAARTVEVRPGAGLRTARWHLQVRVDGPAARTSPAAVVLVHRTHGLDRVPVPLDAQGRGRVQVAFSGRRVDAVTVVLVNASRRFACWHSTTWSCQGRPRDNGKKFSVTTIARRG